MATLAVTGRVDLTDAQWAVLEAQLPPAGRVPDQDAGAAAGTAGSQPGAVRADCRSPDRRAGLYADHVA